ncbi:aminotransferase class III-fold pyridoxal phosphate-dependent enzyme, partial [bacterium]|nr:aminotransferase class III-fold pyridoxal phosphate-dependent enzyme [bacterium]
MAVNPRDSLFAQAKAVIPGGVNSPARSFAGVGGSPVFMRRGEGALIYDEHGKEYIDYCMSWGPLIFGHAPEIIVSALKKALDDGTTFGTATCKEIEFAQLIADAVPCVEKVRLTNSGTEAVMGALRLARAFTRRRGILKFQGAYHGHADYLLVKAGSGLATLGVPDSAGVPHSFTQHTLIAPFNNLEAVEKILRNWYSDLACIIVEPVMGNYGVIPPSEHFLKGLRKLADDYNMLLVFDEVITGFRLAYGGAQEY